MRGLVLVIAALALVAAQRDESYMSADGARVILAEHNRERAEVGIPPMEWSSELAADAAKYAKTCPGGHDTANLRRLNQGENLYWQSNFEADHAKVGRGALVPDRPDTWLNWSTEKTSYDLESHRCVGPQVCGHWTQMVWGATTKVGCAIDPCQTRARGGGLSPVNGVVGRPFIGDSYSPDAPRSGLSQVNGQRREWLVLVCRYSPPGNFVGRTFNQGVESQPTPSRPLPTPVEPRERREPIILEPRDPVIIEPREPVDSAPGPRRSDIPGECPGGVKPATQYFSGCTATPRGRRRFRMRCEAPPAPLSTMHRNQIREMQSFAKKAMRGDTSTCCQVSGRYYCRGPRDGFRQDPVQQQIPVQGGPIQGSRLPCRIVRTTHADGRTTEERFNCD